jgi:hypothetical protein
MRVLFDLPRLRPRATGFQPRGDKDAIRAMTLGKKNWLFMGDADAGEWEPPFIR